MEFFEQMEQVDEAIHRAQTGSVDNAVGHILVALSILRQMATTQHEQIVDLNSCVEYGYTRRELNKR